MPVIRRIAKRQREHLTTRQRAHLLTGWIVGPPNDYSSHFRTREEFAAAWNEHADELLPEFIERNPGQRPLAWWMLNHKRERPLNDEGQAMFATHGERIRCSDRYREFFGFLHNDDLQIPEADYLRDHGLLLPGEIAALEVGE